VDDAPRHRHEHCAGFHHHANCGCVDHIDHPSHAPTGIHVFPRRLYVITMLENPLRWRSRYWNYWAFEKMVEQAGAILYTVEVAVGDRHFEITKPDHPRHLQLRTRHELWHKENAINLMMHRLPPEAQEIAWVDADVQFTRSDWAQETLHQLVHYDVVQMFSHAQDLGPNCEPGVITEGFCYRFIEDRPWPHEPGFCSEPLPGGYYSVSSGKFTHPGFAWAARRSALDHLGGLIDWAILGSGDWHMATALIGRVERSLYKGYSETYKRWCHEWQERAKKHVLNNPGGGVGYVPGLVNHHFHGHKVDRNYSHRWRFLAQVGYDPELDIKRDSQGLWQLTDRSRVLRDGIRKYGRGRNEDAR